MQFEATLIHWRGPSPFFFAPLPPECAEEVRVMARRVSYGWGVIPVAATIKGVDFTTSLIPKDGTYLLPIKNVVRHKAEITVNDRVSVQMIINLVSG